MKFTFPLLLLLLILGLQVSAQVPQGINYQSVARSATGQILTNAPIGVQFAIHDSAPGGPVIYRENQGINTNPYGIFSTVIGAGSVIIGNFQGLNWGNSTKYLQVLMDFSGGTNFTDMGTSEFMSVPYSLYSSGSAGDVRGLSYDTTGVIHLTTGLNSLTGKGVWTTTGNGGLSNTNFIGTTDNADLILKGHNVEAIRYTSGGALLATGSTSTGVTPASGPGTRMMWIPAKSAFRAGTVAGPAWDSTNIGANSIAMGTDVLASGKGTVSIGNSSLVPAYEAMALGNGLIAKSAYEIVFGSYNDTTASGSSTTWNGADPLLELGNGSSTTRSNALVIYKNGNISARGMLLNQALTITPDTIPVVAGATTVPVGTQGFIKFTSNSLAAVTAVTLGAGQKVGQMLMVEVLAAPLNGVTINNGLNLGLSNNNAIMLLWDGTSWVHLN